MLMASTANRPTVVIFDGDDTLWSTEPLYDAARSRARQEVTRVGLDGAEWEALERRIDVQNVAALGFGIDRFPTSCAQAYEALCSTAGKPPVESVRRRVRDAARTVFTSDPPLMSGARQTLEDLRARGVRVALLTKGDLAVQQTRVRNSGLGDLFDATRIVTEKTAATFREIVASLGAVPEGSWSVGNSMRSDILPALTAGLHAIWIDAHVWEHERFAGDISDNGVVKAHTLEDAAEIIERTQSGKRGRRVSAAI
jgi:putative hydrolase of the HAD superfamily